jgi:hypothetical protein
MRSIPLEGRREKYLATISEDSGNAVDPRPPTTEPPTQTAKRDVASPNGAGPGSGGKPARRWLPGDVEGKDILGILGIIGLAVYGSVRFADTAFYSRLGTTPDAVGINYAETLGRVAGPVALLAAIILTLFVTSRLGQQKWTVVRVVAFLVAFAVTVAVAGVLLPATPNFTWFGINWVPLTLAIAISLLARAGKKEPVRRLGNELRSSRSWTLVAVGLSLLIIFGIAGWSGYREAGFLISGDPYSPRSPLPCGCSAPFHHNISLPWLSGSEGFYGIEAVPVEIQWVGQNQAPRTLPSVAFYLGESDSIDVLFDPSTHQSLSVPADSVVLTSRDLLSPFNED